MPAGSEVLSVEFKVNLLRPAKGDKFLAQAEVIKAGKTLTVVKADVFGISGEAGDQILVASMWLLCWEQCSAFETSRATPEIFYMCLLHHIGSFPGPTSAFRLGCSPSPR